MSFDSPGIYRRLVDEPGVPAQPSMNIVGVAVACPNQIYLNEPRLITGGSKELMEIYGKVTQGFEGYSCAKILADMTNIYVCNVASSSSGSSKAATINLVATESADSTDLVSVTAKMVGTSGNSIKVVVTETGPEGFSVKLMKTNGEPLETIKGISLDKTSLTYVDNIKSEYVVFAALEGASTSKTVKAQEYALTGGTDASIEITPANVVDAINALNDETLGVSYIVAPTLSHQKEVVAAMVSALDESGVIRGIICPPKDKLTPKDVTDWTNGESGSGLDNAINNSQIAVYAPWGKIFEPDLNGEIEVSPEIEVIRAELYTQENYQPWFAPAGEDRGRCKYFTSLLTHYPKRARDVLYGGTNVVNPIAKIGTSGFLIYGQKTTLRDTTKSLTRVNVRNLTNYLRKMLEEGTKGRVFEQNDQYTWDQWVNMATNIAKQVQDARGIYEFVASMNPTPTEIDQYVMPGTLAFKPTKTAEFIPITLRLVPMTGNL